MRMLGDSIMSYQGQYYVPYVVEITAISNAYPTVVTTSPNHAYVVGNTARLYIPQAYGMSQANLLSATILAVSSNTATMDLDTRGFDAFSVPSPAPAQPAQLVPVGDDNTGYKSPGAVPPEYQTVPGAFTPIVG